MTYTYTMRTYENDYLRKLEVQYQMILGLLVSPGEIILAKLANRFWATFQPTKARGVAEELAQELLRLKQQSQDAAGGCLVEGDSS